MYIPFSLRRLLRAVIVVVVVILFFSFRFRDPREIVRTFLTTSLPEEFALFVHRCRGNERRTFGFGAGKKKIEQKKNRKKKVHSILRTRLRGRIVTRTRRRFVLNFYDKCCSRFPTFIRAKRTRSSCDSTRAVPTNSVL